MSIPERPAIMGLQGYQLCHFRMAGIQKNGSVRCLSFCEPCNALILASAEAGCQGLFPENEGFFVNEILVEQRNDDCHAAMTVSKTSRSARPIGLATNGPDLFGDQGRCVQRRERAGAHRLQPGSPASAGGPPHGAAQARQSPAVADDMGRTHRRLVLRSRDGIGLNF